jgi:hypothetical protein
MESSKFSPNWADLVDNSQEKVTEEDDELEKMWLFTEAKVCNITMQDTVNNFTYTPARESSCILIPPVIPFKMQPLSNSCTFKSTDTMGISQDDEFIPHPFLNSVATSAPSSLVDDSLLAPGLMNLEMLELH